MNDCGNMAADLRRVAYWIYEGQDELAMKMLTKAKGLYKDISVNVGKNSIWEEVKKIEEMEGGKMKAAERALTSSVILMNQ